MTIPRQFRVLTIILDVAVNLIMKRSAATVTFFLSFVGPSPNGCVFSGSSETPLWLHLTTSSSPGLTCGKGKMTEFLVYFQEPKQVVAYCIGRCIEREKVPRACFPDVLLRFTATLGLLIFVDGPIIRVWRETQQTREANTIIPSLAPCSWRVSHWIHRVLGGLRVQGASGWIPTAR